MHTALKNRIINLIELLPFGHDLYLQLARKRLGISYRGVFDSFAQAQRYAAPQLTAEYDLINRRKGENLEQELPVIDKRVLDIDYPLLFWLSRLVKPSHRILDLGGSIGQSFYSFEHYIHYPANINWVVAELPAAVEAGRRVAKHRGENRLTFIDSTHMEPGQKTDVFITAGTIQYMDTNLAEVLRKLGQPPEHVLIHNTPLHPFEDFWTLQNLEVCEVPYHIHSMANIVAGMEEAGYRLVDRWKSPRRIEIPFHLDMKVDNYFGFYFKLAND